MANLKAGTLIGGNMLWHAGNMPFSYTNGSLYLNSKKIYSELDKPTPAEVGALSLNGGSLNGELEFTHIQSGLGKFSLNMNNANIGGVNAVIFNDPSDVNNEGICFPKTGKSGTSTSVNDYDIIRALDNTLYFNTNKVYHEGFKPTFSDTGSAPEGFGLGESQGARVPNKDLNQAVKAGFYAIYGDDINTPYTNGPSGSRMIVVCWNSQHVTQTFHRVSTGEMWTRTSKPVDGNTVWEAWAKVYDTLRKPTPSEVGAVNKAGDTMTGALIIDHGDIRHRLVHSGQTVAFYQGGHETDDTIQNLAFSGYNGKSLTAHRTYMKDGVSPLVRWGSTDHKIYHAGNKPTASDVGAISTSGGTATGRITAAGFTSSTAGNAFSTAKTSDGSYASVSAESSYVMLWKRNDSSTIADEFIGIQGSRLLFRQDNKTGDKKYSDHAVFHAGSDIVMGKDKALIFPTATYSAGAKIYAKDKNQYGSDLVIQSGGVTIIGSGESPDALIKELPSGDEQMYVTSDANVYFYSGANTWTDRKISSIDTNGDFTAARHVQASNGDRKLRMGVGTSDMYLHNSASNQYLQLRDNGNLDYGSKMVFVDGDSRINGSMISRSQALSTEDLDTIKTAGVYHQSANANALTERHYPVNLAGSLIVYLAAGIIQEYRVYNRAETWTRAQYSSGGWTTWAKTYNTLVKPSASELGVVPASDVNTTSTWADIVNKIPRVTSSGVMEVGKYIDLHDTNSTKDYDVRLTATANYMSLTTQHGTIDIGAQNTTYAHIYTDRAEIYTNKLINTPGIKLRGSMTGDATVNVSELQVNGNSVYHVGRKPTASEIGALPSNTANGTPIAAYYLKGGTGNVGTKIRLPFNMASAKMVSFTVRVYQEYTPTDIQFSGYLYPTNNQWHLPKAIVIAGSKTTGFLVKMGRDTDGYAYVWLEGNNYRGVAVMDVVGGYNEANWNSGWVISETNDAPNLAWEGNIYPPYSPHFKPSLADIGAFPAAGGTATGAITADALGVSNSSITSGKGISLYSGANAGAPSYGMMFSGTGTFGAHGAVIGDWATYFTMSGATNRGWIFKSGNSAGGNIASISADGRLTLTAVNGGMGVYVEGQRQGDANALIRGEVQGGAFVDWRARAAGLTVDCQNSTTAAHAIWKATHWGNKHLAAMDVHGPASGTMVNLHVGGDNTFQFNQAGVLTSAGGWNMSSTGPWCSRVGNVVDWAVGAFTTKSYVWQDLGTYAMFMKSDQAGPVGPGGTCGGHQLSYCPAEGRYTYGHPPGTWQCLGQSQGDGSYGSWNVTIWVRIA